MPSGQDYHGALMDAMAEARDALGRMAPLGRAKAEAERAYRIAKRTRILWERGENGTPVSIISDVVCGYDDIAALRFARDCADAEYEANREALLLAKKQVDTVREIIAREWAASDGR